MQSHTYNKTEKGYKTGRDWGIIVPEKTLWANYNETSNNLLVNIIFKFQHIKLL